jgi:sugar lactone lactonase YvrE
MAKGSSRVSVVVAGAAGVLALAACGSGGGLASLGKWPSALEPATQVAVVEGMKSPESVRYDPEQDVYFVTNFGVGGMAARDNDGFISRVGPDGVVQELKFVEGGAKGVTLHAPRGMFIQGDTLWAVDLDAVRGFDRRTGAPLVQTDLSALGNMNPNDIAAAPDGTLYVTETNLNRVYHLVGRTASVVLADSMLKRPNGIIWDRYRSRFVIVSLGTTDILAWSPGEPAVHTIGRSPGGVFDGVELIGPDRFLVTSQADSSVQVVTGAVGRRLFRVAGRPADLGVDTRRNRVALPLMALNRVEIWQLPRR